MARLGSNWLDFATSLINHASTNATLKKINSVRSILDQQKDLKVISATGSQNVVERKYQNNNEFELNAAIL